MYNMSVEAHTEGQEIYILYIYNIHDLMYNMSVEAHTDIDLLILSVGFYWHIIH